MEIILPYSSTVALGVLFVIAALTIGRWWGWFGKLNCLVLLAILGTDGYLAYSLPATLETRTLASRTEGAKADREWIAPSNWPSANITVNETLTKGDTTIYNTQYTLNDYGQRECGFRLRSEPKHHVLVMGDRLAFGQGMPVRDTMPCHLAQKTKYRFKPYFLASPQASIGHVIQRVQREDLPGMIAQKQGLAIYVLDAAQIMASAGHFSLIKEKPDWPVLGWSNGALRGPVPAARYADANILQTLHALAPYSPTLRWVFRDPEMETVAGRKLPDAIAAGLEQIKRHYDANFQGPFFVLFWARDLPEPRLRSQIMKAIAERGMIPVEAGPTVFDAPTMAEQTRLPSAAEYAWHAEQMMAEIYRAYTSKKR